MFEERIISNLDSDIIVSLVIVVLLSVCIFLLTCFLGRRLNKLWRTVLVGFVIGVIIYFRLYLYDSTKILQILPFANTIIFGNLSIPLAAIVGGLLIQSKKIPLWRSFILVIAIFVLACRPTYRQLMAVKPETRNSWNDGICMQTSNSTCGAASAATLLKFHGIETDEQEMVDLCLTSRSGSFIHGIYRGLRKKVVGTGFKVKAGSCTLEQLQSEIDLPVVVNVRLTSKVNQRDPRYSQVWGWYVNVSHAVIVYEFRDETSVVIADPSAGKEIWDIRGLKDLWQGEYISLSHNSSE